MELLGLVLPIPGIPGELIQYEMVEIGERISYELIYYTGYMGTRTEMIYDMDGFRAWKRPVFFTRLVKLITSSSFLPISSFADLSLSFLPNQQIPWLAPALTVELLESSLLQQ